MNKLSLIKPSIKTNAFDECKIFSITDDSRDAQKNSLFVARQGVQSHGIEFAKEAIQNGKPLTNKKIDTVLFGKPLKLPKNAVIY